LLVKQNNSIINVNTSQSYRRGFMKKLKQIREVKKDNPRSYNEGARDAEKGIQQLKKQHNQPQRPNGGSRQQGIGVGGGMNTKGL
jgi:hypothetical protein